MIAAAAQPSKPLPIISLNCTVEAEGHGQRVTAQLIDGAGRLWKSSHWCGPESRMELLARLKHTAGQVLKNAGIVE